MGGPIAVRDLILLALLIFFTSIMAISLAIAWKWEGIGGMVTASCATILYAALAMGIKRNGIYVATIVCVPFLLPGLLFLFTWLRAKKRTE